MTNSEEILLIKEALENNQAACSRLVEKYREPVQAFILGIIPQAQDAEDICQETFDKAFRNLTMYNSRWAFSTWLFTIAQNTSLDYYRKKKSSPPPLNNLDSLDGNSGVIDLAQSPEENLITNQTFDELINAIKALDPKYRKVAELRFIQEFAYEEIASELSLPVNTVKTRISRAKKLLNNIWKS
ncbi:MAG: hypothetical protein A2X18_13015 [Bacteroidetes bacterium GWF2_40_14]|nr:MAG: hypothetical protein A2X18_13015 [Bacteroidetes bacterium GWF2_40_14]